MAGIVKLEYLLYFVDQFEVSSSATIYELQFNWRELVDI